MPNQKKNLRLSEKAREDLIAQAKIVYFAYLKLNILREQTVKIDDKFTTTIHDYLQANKNIVQIDLQIGNDKRKLRLKIENNLLSFLEIPEKIPDQNKMPIKALTAYQPHDIADLLLGSTFAIHGTDAELKFSTNVADYQIGGAGKIDLYKLHISNLGQIITHLTDKKNADSNMLVSLATGSGKTFTQALLILVLKLAGVNGVFAVPEKLLNQYKEDLKRLLPDKLIDEINQPDNSMIIDSVNNILSRENLPNPENTLLSFDEAHLLAQQENFFVKAKKLAGCFVNLYLTATPTPTLYTLAEGDQKNQSMQVVATMNNAQKVKDGYAIPPQRFAETTLSIKEMGEHVEISLAKRFKRWLIDAVDPETGYNAGNAFGKAYLYNILERKYQLQLPIWLTSDEKLRKIARWNINLSAFQGKTLICANHYEDIVNIDSFIKHLIPDKLPRSQDKPIPPPFSRNLYTNQNIFNRDETYNFFQMSDQNIDADIYKAYEEKLYTQFKHDLETRIDSQTSHIRDDNISQKKSALITEMVKWLPLAPLTNSAHGIVELALSILASRALLLPNNSINLSTILQNFGSLYLDQQRVTHLANPDAFLDTIKKGIPKKNGAVDETTIYNKLINLLQYNEENNSGGISETSAKELAPIITHIIKTINNNHFLSLKIVDNWYADQAIILDLFIQQKERDQLFQFVKAHYKRFVFSHVEKNETINKAHPKEQPFSKFKEIPHAAGLAKDANNNDNDNSSYTPKVRQKRAVEALNPDYKEYEFTPVVCQESQEIIDNLFRLGITTIYVTDKKVEGFNDPNLQQVALIAHSKDNTLASPISVLQADGRNRGLNQTTTPQFILVSQHGTTCVFGVDQLKKQNYQKDFDRAIKQHKKNYIKMLGNQLGENIVEWIEKNKDAFHHVNDEELAKAVIDHCFETLEKLNQANAFEFKMTQKDYSKVLGQGIAYLKKRERSLKQGTILPFFVRVVSVLMYQVARFFRYQASRQPKKALTKEMGEIEKKRDEQEKNGEDYKRAKLYQKMIDQIPLEKTWYHDTVRNVINMNIFNEIKRVFEKEKKLQTSGVTQLNNTLRDLQNDSQLKMILNNPLALLMFDCTTFIKPYIEKIKLCIEKVNADLENIKTLISPLVSDPAYRDMLQFIKNNFSKDELLTIFQHGEIVVDNLLEYINMALQNDLTDEFYKKYYLPKLTELSSHLANPAEFLNIMQSPNPIDLLPPIFTINQHIDTIFRTIHEANLRFYKVTNQGQSKQASFEDKIFFNPVDRDSPYLRKIANDYDVRIVENIHTADKIKQSLLIEQNNGTISFIQVDEEGNKLEFDPTNKNYEKFCTCIKKYLEKHPIEKAALPQSIQHLPTSTILLYELNKLITSIPVIKPDQTSFEPQDSSFGKPLFSSPALTDDNTARGKTWRQLLSLNRLKKTLPVINRITYAMNRSELQAANKAATMLSTIQKKHTRFKQPSPYETQACLFSKLLQEEGSNNNPRPSEEALGGCSSRVQKMKAEFIKRKAE